MIMSWHWVQHTPSTAYTKYSVHQVQYTPSTAYTRYRLSSLHPQDYELTPKCSVTLWRASLHDRPPSPSSPWELKGSVTLSHCHGCEYTNWWKESQLPARRPSTASQNSSKLARLRPPSASPISLDYGLQVYLQTRSITAFKFAWSWPPSASTHSLDHGLQVLLQTRSIMASKCISKLARFQPSSVSLNSPDYGLQVCPIIPSKCISILARSRPWSVSLSSLDHHFQAHFEFLSSTACSQCRYSVCTWVAI